MSRLPSRSARTGGRPRRTPRPAGRGRRVPRAPPGCWWAARRPPPPPRARAGKTGGEGWVAARALHAGGVPVWVAALDPKTDDAIDNRALARVDGVREIGRDEPWPAAAVALDALLGTGATGPARGDVLALAQRLVALGAPLVAVGGPPGLDLSSGEAHGPVRAALSITFGGARRGHLVAREWCGKLIVVDIGFPPPDPAWPVLVSDLWAGAHLPRLAPTMHKGDRGRVTVVGGSNRSEEHTSELQSPCNLVCRLLLEKKKKDRCDCVWLCRSL